MTDNLPADTFVWPLSSELNKGKAQMIADKACTYYYNPDDLPTNNRPIEKITHHF